ncbi:MAG: hypothetical protein KDK37_09815 [Leptospiraceae bacterium]|nr:hypothetical protein [Leptospiraceae bacterium]MCB1304565.1 hypothetical protein [Leptospiraceae bacterium]
MELQNGSLVFMGLIIGLLMTVWSVWMFWLYIRKSRAARKDSSVRPWIILIIFLIGTGDLFKSLKDLKSMMDSDPSNSVEDQMPR